MVKTIYILGVLNLIIGTAHLVIYVNSFDWGNLLVGLWCVMLGLWICWKPVKFIVHTFWEILTISKHTKD